MLYWFRFYGGLDVTLRSILLAEALCLQNEVQSRAVVFDILLASGRCGPSI